MNIWDLIVGLLVVLLLRFAFRLASDRKKGGGCCSGGGDCGSCPGCAAKNARPSSGASGTQQSCGSVPREGDPH